MKKLGDIASITSGIPLSRLKAKSEEDKQAGQYLLFYQTAHCTKSLNGHMSPPTEICIKPSLSTTMRNRKLGRHDILMPRIFRDGQYGVGVFLSEYDNCYPAEHVTVIRAENKLTQSYLSAFLRSERGKKAITQLSTPTKQFSLRAVKITDIRSLEIRLPTKKKMLEVIERDEHDRRDIYESKVSSSPFTNLALVEAQSSLSKGAELESKVAEDNGLISSASLLKLSQDVKSFWAAADSADMTSSIGTTRVCTGEGHSIVLTENETYVVENRETGGVCVFRDDRIITVDGITQFDLLKFSDLADVARESCSPTNERKSEEFCLD